MLCRCLTYSSERDAMAMMLTNAASRSDATGLSTFNSRARSCRPTHLRSAGKAPGADVGVPGERTLCKIVAIQVAPLGVFFECVQDVFLQLKWSDSSLESQLFDLQL